MKTPQILSVLALFFCSLSNAAQQEIILHLSTKVEAERSKIPSDVHAIRTLGYHQPGTGGGLYIFDGNSVPKYNPRGESNVDRPESHYITINGQDGSSRYYVLAEETPNVLQFGAIAQASQPNDSEPYDNTKAFNDALSFGKGSYVPPGRYFIKGTVHILEDGSMLWGVGPGGNHTGGSELIFGPGNENCIQLGNGVDQLRWGKITRLTLDAKQRTGGDLIFAWFNYQLVLDELRIIQPYNGIRLFRGIGFMLKDIVMSGIRAGNGDTSGPSEIGYGIKFGGAADLYEETTGKKIKRNTHVLYVENLSFGSEKHETDPSNWTVGLWCAENAASVNGTTLKNQNVRHGVYISKAEDVDPNDKYLVPEGYRLMPPSWTDTTGIKGPAGKTYSYGSNEYPIEPGTVVNANGRFQDLTLFYLGGDYLGGEYIYNGEGSGIAIYNPHFMRSHQGNCVYMGPNSRDMSIYGGQIIGAYKNGLEMLGERWHLSGVQIYRHSLDSDNRAAHRGTYSAIKVGASSIGGDIVNCKIGNEPTGTSGRGGSTVRYGVDIEPGARSTWIHGNRFSGCLEANVNNQAGDETQEAANFFAPIER